MQINIETETYNPKHWDNRCVPVNERGEPTRIVWGETYDSQEAFSHESIANMQHMAPAESPLSGHVDSITGTPIERVNTDTAPPADTPTEGPTPPTAAKPRTAHRSAAPTA